MIVLATVLALVLALGVLGLTAMQAGAWRQQLRSRANADSRLEAAARMTRRQMNEAAGQSWRNIVD